MSAVHVLLVDDQALVRQGMRALLSFADDIEVVGEAATGDEAVRLAASTEPHVVLMDVRMPDLDGIAATRLIRKRQPTVAVLVVTTFDDDELVLDAVRAGACGFLLKDADGDDLIRAVRVAARGGAVVEPRLLAQLLVSALAAGGARAEVGRRLAALTARERDVLRLIATGCSNSEICSALHVSAATTKSHVSSIFAKLDVRDRAQAVIAAYEGGLVSPGQPA